MAIINNVNTSTPIEFQVQQQALDRQRKMAEALQQESLRPLEGQTAPGGIYVPPSITQHISRLANALVGNSSLSDLDSKQLDIANQRNQYASDQANALYDAMTPKAASPEVTIGEHIISPEKAAYNPNQEDMNKAMIKYLNNMGMPDKAAEYVVSEGKNKMLMNALRGEPAQTQSITPSANQSPIEYGDGIKITNVPRETPSQGSSMQNGAPQSGIQKAYQMLPPEQKDIVDNYLAIGKQEEAIKSMNEYLKPHITSDGRVVSMRSGQVIVPAGSLEAYKTFQNASKQIENENTLVPPSYVIKTGEQVAMNPATRTIADFLRGSPDTGQRLIPAQSNVPINNLPPIPLPGATGIPKNLPPPLNVAANGNTGVPPMPGKLASSSTNSPQPTNQQNFGQSTLDKGLQERLGPNMADILTQGLPKAQEMVEGVKAIDKSLDLIKNGAFLGAGADLKTDAAKVMNNVFGVNVSPDKVANTDFLRSTLGMPLLAKAKTLGYNPTDADTKRLDTILGTISKDPKALPQLLEYNRDIMLKAIAAHNQRASSVNGPYSLAVDMPGPYVYSGPQANQNPLTSTSKKKSLNEIFK